MGIALRPRVLTPALLRDLMPTQKSSMRSRIDVWISISVLTLTAAGLSGCDPLSVSDPTAVQESNLATAQGSEVLWTDARNSLNRAATDGAVASGLLTDEFFADPPDYYASFGIVSLDLLLDQRESAKYEQQLSSSGGGIYAEWQQARRAAMVAIPKLRQYVPNTAHLGETFAVRGLATLRLAEDFCPGFPTNDLVDYKIVYGVPLTTDQAFQRAVADFDSAALYAPADSVRILNFVRLGRGRGLLGLGRFAEAAAAVAQVPTVYVYQTGIGTPFGQFGELDRSVSDAEDTNGLPFVSANDPRVRTTRLGVAVDGRTPIYAPTKYANNTGPLISASGIEARLIEAEAALAAGDPNWLTILNNLRATAITPALSPLSDPGTASTRLDLVFRERAFWLFGTGHRLGDMRRLTARYARAPQTVFPTGPHRLGGVYGLATSIPFPAPLESPYNSAVTGCTSR
jgi:hypothetical protein